MFSRALAVFTFLILITTIFSPGTNAQWIENGNPIVVHSTSQQIPLVVSDGAGGGYLCWIDSRFGTDAYVQHIDSHGRELWTAGGISVSSTGNQSWPAIAPDGEGGLLVAWYDDRNTDSDVYVQRFDEDGNALWTANGVAATTATGNQRSPQIASDGSGGAVVVWNSYISMASYDIYAQRINSSGTALWTTNGEPICTESSYHQNDPRVVVDAEYGYAYFCWKDGRAGGNLDIYAHKYTLAGSRQWAVDGTVVCNATDSQLDARMILDRNHNVIISWRDRRGGSDFAIYAQAMDTWATPLWTANGVAIYSATSGNADEHHMSAVPDGGILVAWEDDRNGTYRSYAQKVSPGGSILWTADGVLVCGVAEATTSPRITTDGLDGALVVWNDQRYESDLYMQHIDDSGNLLWTTNGARLTDAPQSQYEAEIASDGRGGAILVWIDYRNLQYDLYTGRMDKSGNWGFPAPEITSVIDVPGDQGGAVSVAWDASYLDAWPDYVITEYSVWRAIDQQAAMMSTSNGALMLSSAGDLNTAVLQERPSADIFRQSVLAGEPYYWQLVSYDEAFAQENYADVITTLFDSTGVHHDYHYFQVIAHTGDRTVFWESLPDSGYSVDNLAPAAPLALAGEQSYSPEGLQLTWSPNTEADLAGYKIYRGTSESFVPGPGNFVESTPDTASFDDGWSWDAGYWYKVAAVDIHGNESIFAVFEPDAVTGDDPMPAPDATFLAQNWPNPFNPNTTIAFGLKVRGHVSLRIYDASGRLVADLIDDSRPAGQYSAVWNGKDRNGSSVASGVYFYKLTTREFEKTRKMILLR